MSEEETRIRPLYSNEWDIAMQLAWDTFLKFEAPDYSMEGVENFKNFVRDPLLKKMFLKGDYQVIAAFREKDMVGMLGVRNKSHISLLFVDADYHRQGIARGLLEYFFAYAKSEMGINRITVNAAPYATGFYHKMAFWDISNERIVDGIRYTPMMIEL